MGITTDGNSITITDCTITIDNAFDPTTGTASITITPSGGVGTLPAILAGDPGYPPILQAGNTSNLGAGSAATVAFRLLAPGGPGQQSVYAVDMGVPVGAQGGDTFVGMIQGGIESLFNGAQLLWDEAVSLFVPTAPPAPPAAVTLYASSIVSTSGSGAGPRTLTSITVPPQSFSFVVQPYASCVVTGTANTQVNLQAFIGSSSGPQVGIGQGIAGQAVQTVSLIPGVPTGSAANYATVAAGQSATVFLCATQVAATSDDWSTSAASTTFQVVAQPA